MTNISKNSHLKALTEEELVLVEGGMTPILPVPVIPIKLAKWVIGLFK